MKISAAFPSKYMKCSDLDGQPRLFTMGLVEIESIADDERKPVLHFMKEQKGLVLNRTNSKVIAAAYGEDTDGWHGKQIVLFPAMVEFKGDTVEAIRVRKPKPRAAVTLPAGPLPGEEHTEINPPPHEDPLANDVPF